MIFHRYYSSSAGNLYAIEASDGHRLLIDPGVPWQRIEKALNFDISKIDACLISHEHQDHCKAIDEVLVAGIHVWASEGTLRAIEDSLHLHRQCHILHDRHRVKVSNTFSVFPFNVHHDAAEPMGFIVFDNEGESLLYAVDTSHLTQRFAVPFNIIALSCNNDGDIVQQRVDNNEIHESVAKRLLHSHQEWHDCLEYLTGYWSDPDTGQKERYVNLQRCREIYLLHASGKNLDKKAVRKTIEQKTFVKTII